ncbi:hypothetical protein B0T25DRAFT_542301 [Lasiosphaeria hispida]|uniref:Glycosyltransferase family 32 protein n=1 Tax=Lasiosphaeria hispida TaxID=260671 RepID=A0AAJ0HH36_9PEZI|nr:hypothetical protein B0T25DRAFT_542301 [Lasiosphaeria hispida]
MQHPFPDTPSPPCSALAPWRASLHRDSISPVGPLFSFALSPAVVFRRSPGRNSYCPGPHHHAGVVIIVALSFHTHLHVNIMLLSSRLQSAAGLFTFSTLCFIGILYHVWSLTDRPDYEQLLSPAPVAPPGPLIPRKIWYKVGPKGLSAKMKNWTASCLEANPHYEYEFMDDIMGDAYVVTHFAHRPDIVENYLYLAVPILKADILRYLLLWIEGGIWSDLDVSCEGVPIDDWIPPQYKAEAGLVVGWEFDVGWGSHPLRQFTSWTIMSKPRSPHIWQVVENIMDGLKAKVKKHNVTIAELDRPMIGDIVDFTGPRRLTRSIFQSLEKNMTIPRDTVYNLLKPKLVGDVLIMPGYSFAASSNRYGNMTDKANLNPKLVKHHYAGSWKNDKGGEL